MPKDREQVSSLSSVPKIDAPIELPAYPDEKLAENLPKWRDAVEAGKSSAEHLIATIGSKYALTQQQIEAINQLKPIEGEAA
ncbi:hypothetical protein D3C77_761330 [compost metagenome]